VAAIGRLAEPAAVLPTEEQGVSSDQVSLFELLPGLESQE
jgi:hypothetical protein